MSFMLGVILAKGSRCGVRRVWSLRTLSFPFRMISRSKLERQKQGAVTCQAECGWHGSRRSRDGKHHTWL